MTTKPPRGVSQGYRKCSICGTWKAVTRYLGVWMDPRCAASAKGRAAIATALDADKHRRALAPLTPGGERTP